MAEDLQTESVIVVLSEPAEESVIAFSMCSYCSVAAEETWDLAGSDQRRKKQKLVLILKGL